MDQHLERIRADIQAEIDRIHNQLQVVTNEVETASARDDFLATWLNLLKASAPLSSTTRSKYETEILIPKCHEREELRVTLEQLRNQEAELKVQLRAWEYALEVATREPLVVKLGNISPSQH